MFVQHVDEQDALDEELTTGFFYPRNTTPSPVHGQLQKCQQLQWQ
jgi:hypothetical protein